jgi:transposase
MILEKRVVVSQETIGKYKVISQFEEGKFTRKEASLALGVSERQITRMAKQYRKVGVIGLEHGNVGKRSPHRIPEMLQERVRFLASEKYVDFNYQHLHEMLKTHENINISYSSLKRICVPLGANKKLRRRKKIRKHRKRYSSAGLMMQMDGSDHAWVKGRNWTLIAGIDDATSEVPYGEFFPTEGLLGYLAVLRRVIQIRGVPRVIYVDHAAWLSGTAKNDESGQFKRICEELGITLIFANSPQAKGRVERLWQTFQDRLVAEMNYLGITEITQANEYLNEKFLINTWNKKFSVDPKSPESLYLPAPTPQALEEILSYKYVRKVRNDHTLLWSSRLYQITAQLPYSIAKREVEIRENSMGIIQGYYAGKNLELTLVQRTEDRPSRQPITLSSAGLRTATLTSTEVKSRLNIYT